MDWSNFDESFEKLRTILRTIMRSEKTNYKHEIYVNYLEFGSDMKSIVQRIEVEIQKSLDINEKIIMSFTERKEEPETELLIEDHNNIRLLRLDIKSFFIFTKIFLDTLARIIKLCYGEKGKQLSYKMSHLLKNERQERAWEKLDYPFYKGLKDRMLWMDSFVKRRVEIEHYLGSIPSTTISDGKFGFHIRSSRVRSDAVESITHYMEEVLSDLSKVILYIYKKFHSSGNR